MGGGRSNIYSTFFCSFTKLAFTVFAIALHILDSEAQILYQRYQKISPQDLIEKLPFLRPIAQHTHLQHLIGSISFKTWWS